MNILVTGATKGIGEVIANTLEGSIFAVGRNVEKLKQYRNYFVCDLAKEVESLGEYIADNKIDVVVNNAGEYIYKEADLLNLEDIDRLTRINLIAPI